MTDVSVVSSGFYNGVHWEIMAVDQDLVIYWLFVSGIHCFTSSKYTDVLRALADGLSLL